MRYEQMLEIADLLSAMDIPIDVEEGMSTGQLADLICTGLRTSMATSGEDLPEGEGDGGLGAPEEEAVEEPQMVSMSARVKSLESRLRMSLAEQAKGVARLINIEIDNLAANRQCPPARAEQWRKAVDDPAVRMSMVGDKKHPKLVATVSQMTQAREVPEGTFDPNRQKAKVPSRLSQRGGNGVAREEPPPPNLGRAVPEDQQDALDLMCRAVGVTPVKLNGR
jgi:hypothetical protein